MEYRVPTRQKVGDIFITSLTLIIGSLFLYFLVLALLLVAFAPPQGPSDQWALTALLITIGLMILSARSLPIPWWRLRIASDELILSTLMKRSIPLREIVFVHAGHKIGIQSPGERKHAVPLTIETRRKGAEKIFLAPVDAQSCIDHLTATCPWIGGITVEGDAILPRDPEAVESTVRRAGRFYLYSGIPALLFSLTAAILVVAKGTDIFDQSRNPAMLGYQLLMIPVLFSYGIWSIRKFFSLTDGTRNRDG